MNNFVLELWIDELEKCTFYSVKKENHEMSEADRFFEKYRNNDAYISDLNKLMQLIIKGIGTKHGAIDQYFNRFKNKASALPPKASRMLYEVQDRVLNHPFRLYCYRINEEIVIIFNGGIKDQRTDQKSKDVSMKFYEAQGFVKRIEEAFNNNEITLDGVYIIDANTRTNNNILL